MKMPASFAEFSDALQKARIKDGSFCKNELTCMFQRLKSYLDAHAPLTQKALVQSLLNQALDQWEHGEEPLQSAVLQDNKKERTLAIAMPESLFHRVEQYVEAHNGVSKRVFVVGLVAQELQSWLMEQSPDEVQDQEFGPDQDEQGFGMSMTM